MLARNERDCIERSDQVASSTEKKENASTFLGCVSYYVYIKYLNKDFTEFRTNLIEFAKTYFPQTYSDFNESSPGMII